MQDRLDYWKQWWQKEKEQYDDLAAALQGVRRAACAEGNERDAYTGAQLARVIGRTRKGRGLGCDHWSPAELGQLAQCAIDDLAAQLLHVGGPEGEHFLTCTLSRGMWWTFDDDIITVCPKRIREFPCKDVYGLVFTKL